LFLKTVTAKLFFSLKQESVKKKDYELYKEALSKAFVSIYALNYKYKKINQVSSVLKANAVTEEVIVPAVVKKIR
jgi:hypothetical protein